VRFIALDIDDAGDLANAIGDLVRELLAGNNVVLKFNSSI